MKILYLVTQAERGGAQKYVLELAKHFRGEIAAGTDSPWLFDQAKQTNIPTHPLKNLRRAINPIRDLLGLFELMSLIKKTRPDLIHSNSSKAGMLASLAGVLTRTPVLYTSHGFVFLEKLPGYKKLIYRVSEKFSGMLRQLTIAVSEKDRRSGIAYGIGRADSIRTIHNGIGPIPFLPRQLAREKLGLRQNQFVFGTIANLYFNKGLDVLIQAAARCPDDTFVVIGQGPEADLLNRQWKQSNVKNFIFQGGLDNAAEYLPAFDAFVLSSRKEGLPFTILEAMQAGLPIITTDVGGIKEALDHAGLLVAPEDADQLANALHQIKTDAGLRAELSQKAKTRSQEFTLDRTLAQTQKIYSELVGTTNGSK
jgi:glycosyltransferase involved in cell wall biosynthesis